MSISKKIKLHLLGDKYLLFMYFIFFENWKQRKKVGTHPCPQTLVCNTFHKFPMNVYHHGILYLTNIMESRNKKSCICWEIASHSKVIDRRCLYRLWIMQLNTHYTTTDTTIKIHTICIYR